MLLRITIIFALLISAMLQSGCAHLGNHHTSAPLLSASTYLSLAATSGPPKKQRYLILAANRYMQQRQFTQAQHILSSIDPSTLGPQIAIQYQFSHAHLLILNHLSQQALPILGSLASNNGLNLAQMYQLANLHTLAYQDLNQPLLAINAFDEMENQSSSQQQRQKALTTTWDYLQTLANNRVAQLLNTANLSNLQQGWLRLSQIANQATNNNLMDQLHTWQETHPHHPANPLITEGLNNNTHQFAQLAQKVTLLLPLKGRLGTGGIAIRNGFLAAYYYAKQQGQTTPSFTVLDTSGGHIGDLYHQALSSGSQLIIGPLTKPNITDLIHNNLPIPTLALNTLNNTDIPTKNLYQFGLSPQDATRQIINYAWQNGHTHALVITPSNTWGQGLASYFNQSWQNKGGAIIATVAVNSTHQLSNQLKQILGIDASNARYQKLKRLFRKKIRFIPRRRQDIDMVYAAAQPQLARQIRPLLKFYYAGDINVFATSTIYSGIAHTALDRDLNGIIFPDMPWVLDQDQALPNNLAAIRNNIQSLWPNSFKHHSKLYALGVDAYQLVSGLNRLSLLPQFGMYGATGRLYLKANQHIYRKLLWAKMDNATPKLLENNG